MTHYTRLLHIHLNKFNLPFLQSVVRAAFRYAITLSAITEHILKVLDEGNVLLVLLGFRHTSNTLAFAIKLLKFLSNAY